MKEVKDGSKYIPFNDRESEESVVYFTRDLSPEGLKKAYERVNEGIDGKIAIKLHTGEPHGPNIIPSSWIKDFMKEECPDATIIETNTYYEGDRYTTEKHRKTLMINGWDFCPVDIIDEDGTIDLPVENGKWFDHNPVDPSIKSNKSFIELYLEALDESDKMIKDVNRYLAGKRVNLDKVFGNKSYVTGLDCDIPKDFKAFQF